MRDETFELVDESGRVVGHATRAECHGDPELIHQAVHVLVFDAEGRLFLQKRSRTKDIQPGKWDTSVGGHMQPGEQPAEAAAREMREELGIATPLQFAYQYLWRTNEETEFVRTYRARHAGGALKLCPEEIEEGRFWTLDEIEQNLGTGLFTPNFEHELRRATAAGLWG